MHMRRRLLHVSGRRRPMAIALLVALLILQLSVGFISVSQGRGQKSKARRSRLTEDQRIAHVLSRLTFGARPGDFERVKAMGVDAFIAQQLDADTLDYAGLLSKLGKLPTLGMATPVIFEQYTPPKPAVSPSPAKSADTLPAPVRNGVAQNAAGTSTSKPAPGPSPNSTAIPAEMQMEAKKEMSASEIQKPESMKGSEAMPRLDNPQRTAAAQAPAAAPKP